MTPQEFRNAVIGHRFDIDGYYGAQCWDGYAYYMERLGYPYAHCTSSGYVKDIWLNRASNGMLKTCKEVTVMQAGDIAVFREVAGWTPTSHIAIFMKDLGGGYGWFLGQNQGGVNGAFNEIRLPYSATYDTAFRPNCYAGGTPPTPETGDVMDYIPSDFRYENGKFTVTIATPIRIRKAPSTSGVDTGLTYGKGDSVYYDGFVRRQGYVWISWISASSGTRRWMAAGELNSQGVNVNPYGTFS